MNPVELHRVAPGHWTYQAGADTGELTVDGGRIEAVGNTLSCFPTAALALREALRADPGVCTVRYDPVLPPLEGAAGDRRAVPLRRDRQRLPGLTLAERAQRR